jgi:ABC-2 type transport system permease protein
MTAMRAELLKLRLLPTPRWSAAFLVATLVLGIAATWKWGTGLEQVAVDLALGLPTAIVSVVIGAWVIGVEYGQKTMSRLLASDPRRSLVVIRKILTAILATAVLTAVLYALGYLGFAVAAEGHGSGLDRTLYLDQAQVALVTNLVYTLIGVGFALVTASMAGGLTAAFVFIFVFSTFFSILPEVGDWSFSIALSEVTDRILGQRAAFDPEALDPNSRTLAASLGILIGWVVLIVGAGWIRFVRSEGR